MSARNSAGDAVLPVYLAVDVSASITREARADVDRVLADIERTSSGELVSHVRIAYIQFAERAHVLEPLREQPGIGGFPPRSFGGTTNLAALFTLLGRQVTSDVQWLALAGFRVCRPVVLLITDGQFGPDWEPAFCLLTEYDTATGEGFFCYPFVVPLGVGRCDRETLREVAHPPFIAGLAESVRGREAAVLSRLYDTLSTSFVAIGSPSKTAYDEDDFV